MKVKKLISVCLSAAMVLSSVAPAFSAEATSNSAVNKFTDTEGHWASAAIEKWSGFHVLNGSDGLFRPDGYITRAEMATILDNMMGYQKTSKNSFSDVPSGAWYTTAVLKANAAGILNGDGSGHANPTDRITREQAALMLARAFSVDDNPGSTSKFIDKQEISSWAKSQVFGMEAAGFISGYHSKFNPKSSITRAEVVTMINNAVKGYFMNPGTYTTGANGLTIIKSDGVTLKDAVIDGDLIIAEGVAEGNVILDGAVIKGTLIARGGGENSVVITGGAEVKSVKVEKLGGKIRIFADGVVINELDAAEQVILEGTFGTVTVAADVSVTIKGNIAELDLRKGSIADIQSGTITALNIPSGATAIVTENASVKTLNVTGSAEIKGTGKIEVANISGDGAKIQQTPAKTNLSEGASATVGGKTIGATPTPSGSKGSSGGSGGSSGAVGTPYSTLTADGELLKAFTLLGITNGGKMNDIDYTSDAAVYYVANQASARKRTFSSDGTAATSNRLIGNFVELWDTDEDGSSDLILSVSPAYSKTYWDSQLRWIEGAGINGESDVEDEIGQSVFGQEYTIPMGERLLTGAGLEAWSGATDFNNIIEYGDDTGETLASGLNYYWPQHRYYDAESNDTLTLLTNYKTAEQTTGSNCGPTSALTVLEWFGERGDLNENDLVALREKTRWGGATMLDQMQNIFENLSSLGLTDGWELYSSYDNKYGLYDSDWIQDTLSNGIPIMVGWNSFGGHWQVIIGYDNMGTPGTADDVLILMDPYDSTDHRNDGYNIQSYERLAYGRQGFDNAVGYKGTLFLTAVPSDWSYTPKSTGYTISTTSSAMNFGAGYGAELEANWIPYRDTADDIYNIYPDTEIWGSGDDGLAGPATGSYRHTGDVPYSSYYSHFDFYNINSDSVPSLVLLEQFRTTQQATEWTCGLASALMSIEWFGENNSGFTEIDLAQMRQGGKAGATTVNGMEEVFETLNEDYGGDWAWFTMRDLDDWLGIGDHYLGSGTSFGTEDGLDGLIPYLLSNGIPMMIGWDEWGGHWQVIIGYDDMGTPETQDDVLILADPYDTTDHNMDGYVIESFERLVYGWDAAFDEDNAFIVAFPASENPDVIQELGLEAPYFTPKK
ncbi:hypothetical protein FRZ06_20680 [Anoxybacterium hadale]|uniref:Uncharacterized protein n=1 Tax=Anoxybacterium hadale TaxID=3408580 RepID=A0ACD1AH16_9FIRM|nr:hypothetical protein FRZ06_20680 [Clostridiales bacterium]